MLTSPIGVSVVRYATSLVVSYLLVQAAKVGLDLPESDLTELVTLAVSLLWYSGARVLETHVDPRFGRLLGSAKAPTYTRADTGDE